MGKSHYCNLSLLAHWLLPTTIKEALSGLTLVHQLLSNKKKPPQSWPSCKGCRAIKKKRSLRSDPCMLAARCQKNPSQSWPSHTLHQASEKALSRAISLAPMATCFPLHLVLPGLLPSKQSYPLSAWSLQGQTQELQGSLRTRLLCVHHTQKWG